MRKVTGSSDSVKSGASGSRECEDTNRSFWRRLLPSRLGVINAGFFQSKKASNSVSARPAPIHPHAVKDLDGPATPDPHEVARPSSFDSVSRSPDDGIVPLYVFNHEANDRVLRGSKSMPRLMRNLSNRFTSSFGDPTIVHRPKLRDRPRLNSIHNIILTSNSRDCASKSAQEDSYPSNFQDSTSVSVGDNSTAKTSLESNTGTKTVARQEKMLSIPALTIVEEAGAGAESAAPSSVETLVVVTPTIKTVETTANAKIFFETHFNSILSGAPSARSIRWRELERKLLSESLTAEQRLKQLELWREQESDYLRQVRVLKSQSFRMTGSRGVSVAGYEVIRVLGKGSFGVVRLVREKIDGSEETSSTPDSRRESVASRSSAFSSFIPNLERRKSFGLKRVRRARHQVYAMKVIRKSEMIRNSQEAHLRAERDFLVASEKSRWTVPLVASFQDQTNLYLVMDYMIGGDFLSLLLRRDRLEERRTKFYIAEMVLCLEEAHRLKWIHRDVKPDNFLISASGHLKISDFGLAFDGHWAHDQSYFSYHRYWLLEKLGLDIEGDSADRAEKARATAGRETSELYLANKERKARQRHHRPSDSPSFPERGIVDWRNRHGRRAFARSVVGTSQYMAPEVIKGEEYDGRCDWWSIGIIMYEVSFGRFYRKTAPTNVRRIQCLYGQTPFLGEDRQETKAKIVVG